MSTTYNVIAGDTFELIARKKYGDDQQADRIARANPGVVEPLVTGAVITVPLLPGAPQDLPPNIPSNQADEVAILIDGERFRFWQAVRIVRSIDSMDTAEFGAPFDAAAPGFRDAFRPFSYKPVDIAVGGSPLFRGTMIDVAPAVGESQKAVSVGCYSIPGVLNDCTPPASAFPLEFNDQGLREIAASIAAPFGVSVDFLADQGAVFERAACEPDKKALSFLTDLAKQRNLIISSSQLGALIFWQSVLAGSPVARLQQGMAPVLSVTPFFSPQEYYSHISGLEPVIAGLSGSQFTVQNPRLRGVVRPITFNTPDTLDADVRGAVEARAGRMFGNVASYSVTVATWRDPNGALWEPNTTIKLLAPGAMIYNEYEFLIRSVEFNRDRASKIATLNLVVPGSFNGQIPEVLPWDD